MTAYSIMPKEQWRPFECDSEGLEFVLSRLALRGITREQCEIKEIKRVQFDFGGMVRVNEEIIDVEVNGTKFGAILTQFPWAIEVLRTTKPDLDKSSDFIRFTGMMGWGYCMSTKTRDALVWKMEQLWPEVSIKCQKAEDDLINALTKAGGISRRPPQPEILP